MINILSYIILFRVDIINKSITSRVLKNLKNEIESTFSTPYRFVEACSTYFHNNFYEIYINIIWQHSPVTEHRRIRLWRRCRSAAGKSRTCRGPWAGATASEASRRPGAGQPVRQTRTDAWSPWHAPWPVRHGNRTETCPSTRPTVAPTVARTATADPVEENETKLKWLPNLHS